MYNVRRFFSFMVICMIVLFLSFNPQPSWADGVIVGSSGHIISEPGQKAMIVWDKDFKKETLILNASFGIESLTNFCWIIPIQSSEDPNVRASDAEVFEVLEDLFPISTRWDWYGHYQYMANFTAGASSVEVINIYKIGVYDLAVVWADDPEDFTDWLVDNGYNVPAGFANQIEAYTSAPDGSYFVANKVNLENEFALPLTRLELYSPGIYAELMADDLDRLDISSVIDELKSAIVIDIKDGEDYDPNSFTAHIMDQDEYEDLQDKWHNDEISSYTLRNRVQTYITSSILFETIIDLFDGAGTPIEITFYPDEPTYPLYISALASNWGGIDVYFIGPYTVEDESNILTYWRSAELSSSVESELEDIADIDIPDSCHYVSLLIYRGYLDSLDDDAVFVRYRESQTVPYRPPYYYPPYSPYTRTPFYYPSLPPAGYYSGYYSATPPIVININYPFGGSFGGYSGGYYAGGGYYPGGYSGWRYPYSGGYYPYGGGFSFRGFPSYSSGYPYGGGYLGYGYGGGYGYPGGFGGGYGGYSGGYWSGY